MERISVHQFMIVSASMALGITFFPIAQTVTKEAGRDGWWCVLPGFLAVLPFALMILSLFKRFPGKNLIEISDNIIGKWSAKGIGLVYISVSTLFGSHLLALVGDTFKRTVMPLIPDMVFIGSMLILVVMLVWAGIEVYGRFTEIVFPIVFLSLILTMLFSIPRFEWDQFYPVLANGIKPLAFGVLKVTSYGMQYILFLAGVLSFLPREQENQKRFKTEIQRALILVGMLNTLVVLIQIMVFGPDETKRLNFGLLTLGRMIEIGETISGIESLFMMFWMGAMIIRISGLFFMVLWGLRSVFGIKDELKWYLILAGVFYLVGSLASGPKFARTLDLIALYVNLPFASLWVLTVWGIAYWKQKGVQG
ncbi:MAG: endospore germination permease [Desulfitobacterium hafniense]|nr:endospore germination permease [Desulfitobacterium hafniense]